MELLQCRSCGSKHLSKIDNGYVCDYCGCRYTNQQMQAIIQGVVEVDNSDAELKRYLSNILVDLQAGKVGKAFDEFRRLAKKYTSNPCVWEEWLNAIYQAFPTYSLKQGLLQTLALSLRDIKEIYKYALITAKSKVDKDRVTNNWNSYWLSISKKIKEGTCYIVGEYSCFSENNVLPPKKTEHSVTNGKAYTDFPYLHIVKQDYALDNIMDTACSLHPSIAYALDEGINRASVFSNSGITFGKATLYDTKPFLWWPIYRNQSILFLTDKYFVYEYGDGEGGYLGVFVISNGLSFDNSFISTAMAEASNNHKALDRCPFCDGRLKKSIWGRHCSSCKKKV